MKKIILFLLILCSINLCFAQEAEAADTASETSSVKASKGGISEIPDAKRPKPIDKEKAAKAAEKDESEKDYENTVYLLRFLLLLMNLSKMKILVLPKKYMMFFRSLKIQ